MAVLSFPALIQSYQSVAQQIDAIEADCGIEGMLLTFPDFVQGIRDFGTRVRPFLGGTRVHPPHSADRLGIAASDR